MCWLRVKIKAKAGTSGRIVLSCKLDHRTRQFLICWLRVYAWLHVKIKVKSTGVSIVLWCGLDHGTRQFLMCWLRVKIKAKSTGVRSVLRGGWIIERGNLLCAGYASTRGYTSNLRLTVLVFVVFCHGPVSLNEAISYVLATRLRGATRQT